MMGNWSAVLVLAAVPFVASCVSHQTIPATELPAFTRSIERFPDGFQQARGIGGEVAHVDGEVKHIDILDTTGRVSVFEPPMQAVLSDDKSKILIMQPYKAPREYALSSIRGVDIAHYDTRASDYVLGGTLLALSLPFFIGGTTYLVDAEDNVRFSGMVSSIGAISMVVGTAIAVPGIYLIGRPLAYPTVSDRDAIAESEISVQVSGIGSEAPSPRERFVRVGPLGISGAF
jgi:hypothetical protein